MSACNIHVFHDHAGWALCVEGRRAPISHYPSQKQAIAAGTAKAQRDHTEVFIHRRGDRIGMWNNDADDLRDTD